MSEYGFQSYPLLSSIERFTAPADRKIGSPVLSVHQKHPRGDAIISRFMRETYGEPVDFEGFCYLSQVLQADGLRVAFEAHRRAMPFCMGSLYWQLGDCWPAISWSSIDYYGRWKALHYQAARSFAPVLLSIETRDDGYRIHGVSDLGEPVAGTLVLELIAFDGTPLWRRERPVEIAPNSAGILEMVARTDLPDTSEAVLKASIVAAGEVIASNHHVLGLASLAEPGLILEAVEDGAARVTARQFARAVHVTAEAADGEPAALNFSDNFFDLFAGETRTIAVRDGRRFDPATLRVLSLHEARIPPTGSVIGNADGQPLLSSA
jgi:beta-mannosidase